VKNPSVYAFSFFPLLRFEIVLRISVSATQYASYIRTSLATTANYQSQLKYGQVS